MSLNLDTGKAFSRTLHSRIHRSLRLPRPSSVCPIPCSWCSSSLQPVEQALLPPLSQIVSQWTLNASSLPLAVVRSVFLSFSSHSSLCSLGLHFSFFLPTTALELNGVPTYLSILAVSKQSQTDCGAAIRRDSGGLYSEQGQDELQVQQGRHKNWE